MTSAFQVSGARIKISDRGDYISGTTERWEFVHSRFFFASYPSITKIIKQMPDRISVKP